MGKSAYEISHRRLVNALGLANIRLGVMGERFLRDPNDQTDLIAEVRCVEYLTGALIARLEGATPPFCRGDMVRFKLPGSGPVRIERVYHLENCKWAAKLAGTVADELFAAGMLELVTSARARE